MRKYVLTLDLKDNPKLIEEYEKHHNNVWPEVEQSIKDSDIQTMEIYRVANRLVMILETEDSFSFEKKKIMDENNLKVQQWEQLMLKYQQRLKWSNQNEKWILLKEIYKL